MKLIFTKDTNNEIDVKLQKGTIIEDFTYTEMVRQLLTSNSFEDSEFNNLAEEEEDRLRNMLKKISDVFAEEKNEDGENV